jgi:tRNA-splicing ligase RtcB
MKKYFISLPDPDLAYLTQDTPEFENYIRDLLWSQAYAMQNRDEMMNRVLTELSYAFYKEGGHEKEMELERVNCHHNFTQLENHFGKNVWLTRKGAIQARIGQLGIIPGSMGTKSYIIRGKGNPLSYSSCSHGAGRRFSRNEARRRLTMEDFEREMKGIECRKSEALIDELPSAYKDIDQVMEDQNDLVEIVATLKQVVSVKGD